MGSSMTDGHGGERGVYQRRLEMELIPQMAAHLASALSQLDATPRLHRLFRAWDSLQPALAIPMPLTATYVGEDTWHMDWEPYRRRVPVPRATTAIATVAALEELLQQIILSNIRLPSRATCQILIRALVLLLDPEVDYILGEPELSTASINALRLLVEASESGAEVLSSEPRAMGSVAQLLDCRQLVRQCAPPQESLSVQATETNVDADAHLIDRIADRPVQTPHSRLASSVSKHMSSVADQNEEDEWVVSRGKSTVARCRKAREAVHLLLHLCERGYVDEVASLGSECHRTLNTATDHQNSRAQHGGTQAHWSRRSRSAQTSFGRRDCSGAPSEASEQMIRNLCAWATNGAKLVRAKSEGAYAAGSTSTETETVVPVSVRFGQQAAAAAAKLLGWMLASAHGVDSWHPSLSREAYHALVYCLHPLVQQQPDCWPSAAGQLAVAGLCGLARVGGHGKGIGVRWLLECDRRVPLVPLLLHIVDLAGCNSDLPPMIVAEVEIALVPALRLLKRLATAGAYAAFETDHRCGIRGWRTLLELLKPDVFTRVQKLRKDRMQHDSLTWQAECQGLVRTTIAALLSAHLELELPKLIAGISRRPNHAGYGGGIDHLRTGSARLEALLDVSDDKSTTFTSQNAADNATPCDVAGGYTSGAVQIARVLWAAAAHCSGYRDYGMAADAAQEYLSLLARAAVGGAREAGAHSYGASHMPAWQIERQAAMLLPSLLDCATHDFKVIAESASERDEIENTIDGEMFPSSTRSGAEQLSRKRWWQAVETRQRAVVHCCHTLMGAVHQMLRRCPNYGGGSLRISFLTAQAAHAHSVAALKQNTRDLDCHVRHSATGCVKAPHLSNSKPSVQGVGFSKDSWTDLLDAARDVGMAIPLQLIDCEENRRWLAASTSAREDKCGIHKATPSSFQVVTC